MMDYYSTEGTLERRFEHGPKKVHRMLRKGQFRDVTLILRAEFDTDPEFLDDIVQGVYQRLVMAIRNQAKCGHGQDARKIWAPAFERAVQDATGLPLAEFISRR